MTDWLESAFDGNLPGTIPIFPLPGALLLPRGKLPLNIFEPRYLNMIDDALAGDRLIGMVQTRTCGDLFQIGCVGRLTAFTETDDRRYLITLSGVSRFRIICEIETQCPYRCADVSWGQFDDRAPADGLECCDRSGLLAVLQNYLTAQNLSADWKSVENAPCETLVNSLAMILPFTPEEKQALLEAPDISERAEILTTLMQMAAVDGGGGFDTSVQ